MPKRRGWIIGIANQQTGRDVQGAYQWIQLHMKHGSTVAAALDPHKEVAALGADRLGILVSELEKATGQKILRIGHHLPTEQAQAFLFMVNPAERVRLMNEPGVAKRFPQWEKLQQKAIRKLGTKTYSDRNLVDAANYLRGVTAPGHLIRKIQQRHPTIVLMDELQAIMVSAQLSNYGLLWIGKKPGWLEKFRTRRFGRALAEKRADHKRNLRRSQRNRR